MVSDINAQPTKAKRPGRSIKSKFQFVMDYLQQCEIPVAGFDICEDRIVIHSTEGQKIQFKDDAAENDELLNKILNR